MEGNNKHDNNKTAQSKDWLKPASVSLQKLDQVCTNIYNLGLTDSKHLKATGSHGIKAESKHSNGDPDKPPLPQITLKKTPNAWGSSGSIPHLIKKQVERQRSRPESAKVHRQMRPPSGRTTRPQSAKELVFGNKTENAVSSHQTVTGIKGAQCSPLQRPDGTSVYLAGTVSFITDKQGRTKEDKDDDHDCEYLYSNGMPINHQLPDVSNVRDLSPEDGVPPPPPRGSPNLLHMIESQTSDTECLDSVDKMISNLLDSNNPGNKHSKTVHELQLPKPEPIRFSVPTAEVENEEIRVSFDENGVVINTLQYNGSNKNETKKENKESSGDLKYQSVRSCHSPETLIGQENLNNQKEETEERLFTHPKCIEVNLVVEDPGEVSHLDLKKNLAPSAEEILMKEQPSVKFDEAKNTTIEITPRESKKSRPQSAKLSINTGKRELRYVKSRTDSGMSAHKVKTIKKPDYDNMTEKKIVQDVQENCKDSEGSKSKLSVVTVNYLDDIEAEERRKKIQKPKKLYRETQDVETCVSHFLSSDDDCNNDESDGDLKHNSTSGKRIISKPEENYYELIRNASDSEGEERGKKVKTIKTIELTSDGLVKETVYVSALDAVETKPHKTYVAPRPASAKRTQPLTAKKSESQNIQSRSETNVTSDLVPNPVRRQRVRSAPPSRQPDILAETIKEIHRSVSQKTKACGCKGQAHCRSKVVTFSLTSKDKSARRYYTNYPMEEKKEKTKTELPERVVEIWTRKDEFEIETEGVKECKEMHMKLIEAGVPVTLETLKRGLLPPTEYGFAGPTYKSAIYPSLPPNYTDSLLSDPATSWLSEEHRRVMQLKKKVREATKALEEQREQEAREAREAEARAMKKAKRRGSKKIKKKRPKSAN